MKSTLAPPLEQAGVLDQIGSQLSECLEPSSNQLAVLSAVRTRHQRALVKAVEHYLDRRQALLSVILAPVEGASEGTGEVRTALRATNKGHQGAVAAAVGVSMEIRSVLSPEQRRQFLGFSPSPSGSTVVRQHVVTSLSRLTRLDRDIAAGRLPSKAEIKEIREELRRCVAAFGFTGSLQILVGRMVVDAVWFWSFLPSLRPAGVVPPRSMAALAALFAGLEVEGPTPWCRSLAQAFDSAVLPAEAESSRVAETALGLVLMTEGFLLQRSGAEVPRSAVSRPDFDRINVGERRRS